MTHVNLTLPLNSNVWLTVPSWENMVNKGIIVEKFTDCLYGVIISNPATGQQFKHYMFPSEIVKVIN